MIENNVIIPICSHWINLKRLAKANICGVDDVLSHLQTLKAQGFPVSVEKNHVRFSERRKGGSQFPDYWNSVEHNSVWNKLIYDGKNKGI